MPVTYSPLRYPGGKTQLSSFVESLIKHNGLVGGVYVEPFAGGAGIAWHLLRNHIVENVVINDLSVSIYSFWFAVLNHTVDFCEMIESTPITIDQWYQQKDIQRQQVSGLELGFSTFFLNRVNRSGIINAGVIGGKAQSGLYKLDCRFNKLDLIKKIQKIASYSKQIQLSNLDAGDFLETKLTELGDHVLINIDPPYYNKGKELYQNFFDHEDHVRLASIIANLDQRWMLTYDDTPEIYELYKVFNPESFSLNYTAQIKRKGSELIVFSSRLRRKNNIGQLIA
ncbi:DNA methyltransferase [Methylomonas sp. LWB]|uniref:DNA adenine methylase n=1 Tax=Methylomonas sp. LWB TaxID=1905845 RepID=UPI0008DB0563|nr:DNA adenine methylase [Methylomonas sp. LWB]OHX35745.1 DNA methyltransferase [Methylomonas sp. LWB]